MKKITYIFCLFTMLLGTVSCENFLDITPDGQVDRDKLLSTPEGVEDALYGCYSQLRNTSLYGQELSFSTMEILAQYMNCKGNTTVTALGNYDYANTNVKDVFEGIWVEMYKNISNVNSIINSPLVSKANAFPFNIYRGEALALRAFMHFDLVRLFPEQITQNPTASGIPYATTFSLNTPEFESVAKNYEHILADLLEAEELLKDEKDFENTTSFMKDRQIHINLYAVQGLLARVYLTMGNKEKAAEYALKVIDHSGYTLSDKTEVQGDLAGILSKKETLFGVYYGEFYKNVKAKLQETTSYFSLNPRNDIMSVYEREADGLDFRSSAYFTTIDLGGTPTIRLSKLTEVYELQGIPGSRPSDLTLGINLIRMPEMYYIAAEALLQTNYEKAVQLFDEVLTHRGLKPLSERGTKLTLDLINLDRYKEFIGEGQTFFNCKRLNLPIEKYDVTSSTVVTVPADKKVFVVPVPDIEIGNRW